MRIVQWKSFGDCLKKLWICQKLAGGLGSVCIKASYDNHHPTGLRVPDARDESVVLKGRTAHLAMMFGRSVGLPAPRSRRRGFSILYIDKVLFLIECECVPEMSCHP